MHLIVGLGNPEEEYGKTRHNMGFNVVNELAKKYGINISREKFSGLYGTGEIEGEKVILLKPQTFMNNSGECVVEFKKFYKFNNDDILVIYDDMDVEPGKIRIRQKGSSGSHNGMKSVVQCLATENFKRIRVGIGKPANGENIIEYVIGRITKEDEQPLIAGVKMAEQAAEAIIKYGIAKAMNDYN